MKIVSRPTTGSFSWKSKSFSVKVLHEDSFCETEIQVWSDMMYCLKKYFSLVLLVNGSLAIDTYVVLKCL